MLTHRVGLQALLVSGFPYNTRRVEQRQDGMQNIPRQLRYGEQFGHISSSSLAGRSFRHQALVYNQVPAHLRGLNTEHLKPKLKKSIKANVPVR